MPYTTNDGSYFVWDSSDIHYTTTSLYNIIERKTRIKCRFCSKKNKNLTKMKDEKYICRDCESLLRLSKEVCNKSFNILTRIKDYLYFEELRKRDE